MSRSEDKEEEAKLAAEFLEMWEGDDLYIDQGQVAQGWLDVKVEAEDIAVTQLERVAEFWRRAQDDTEFWLDAIRSAHLSLTAGMVTALEGSAGIGAMRPRAAKKVLDYLNTDDRRDLPFPREDTMSFLELMEAIQKQERLDFGPPLQLSEDQKLRMKKLNWFRELIDHPKFTRWSLPIEDVRDALILLSEIFEELINCAPQRYYGPNRKRVTSALALLGR